MLILSIELKSFIKSTDKKKPQKRNCTDPCLLSNFACFRKFMTKETSYKKMNALRMFNYRQGYLTICEMHKLGLSTRWFVRFYTSNLAQ